MGRSAPARAATQARLHR